jgi:FixJ family two-component response regulator
VVEDDASMSLAVERILLVGGMSSELFQSAKELLATEQACIADCLVIDIRLTGLSVLDLVHKLFQGGRLSGHFYYVAR